MGAGNENEVKSGGKKTEIYFIHDAKSTTYTHDCNPQH